MVDDFRSGTICNDVTVVQQHCPLTEILYSRHVVAHKQNCSTAAGNLAHFSQTLALKLSVTHCKDFIDDENFRVEMSGDGECQTHTHSAGIPFKRGVQKSFDARKFNNRIEVSVDLDSLHPENGTVEIDVFSSGQFGVKAGSHFEKAGDSTTDFN